MFKTQNFNFCNEMQGKFPTSVKFKGFIFVFFTFSLKQDYMQVESASYNY